VDGERSIEIEIRSEFFPAIRVLFSGMAAEAGLSFDGVGPLSQLLDQPFDDLYHQHLIELSKA
jgi:hypothetical protein